VNAEGDNPTEKAGADFLAPAEFAVQYSNGESEGRPPKCEHENTKAGTTKRINRML
jgi:hypothetical protein